MPAFLMHPDLADLLRRRLAVIADHAWRDRDPASHLEALKQASEDIAAWTAGNRTNLDPQLRHYLANSSFDKALAHIAAG
jgi:NADPH-dependent ferric siderophore reductase